jgi:hypothetical protein
MTSDQDQNPMLSRSGKSDPSGKLHKRLDIPLSEELEESIIALATLAGLSKAEYARTILERHVYGELTLVRRMTHRGGVNPSEKYPKTDCGE